VQTIPTLAQSRPPCVPRPLRRRPAAFLLCVRVLTWIDSGDDRSDTNALAMVVSTGMTSSGGTSSWHACDAEQGGRKGYVTEAGEVVTEEAG
jgi:hypothetical protein